MSLFAQSERLSLVAGGPVEWQTLTFWHNSVAQLQVAFYNLAQDALLQTADFVGVSMFTFELYTENTARGELLLTKSFDAGDLGAPTLEQWLAGTAAHVTMEFFAPELNLAFEGAVGTFHYVFYVTTASGLAAMASGPFICRRNLAAFDTLTPTTLDQEVDADGNPIVDADGNPIEIVT